MDIINSETTGSAGSHANSKAPGAAMSLAAARELRGGVLPHVPPPASPVGSKVRLDLEAADGASPEIVFTDPRREEGWRVAMDAAGPGRWTAEILLPQEPTLLRYHFVLADGSVIRERRQKQGVERFLRRSQPEGMSKARLRALTRVEEREVLVVRPTYGQWKAEDFRIACYLRGPQSLPPAWVRGQVFYQIFPDRFARAGETPRRATTYGRPALHQPWDVPPEHPPKSRDFYGGNLRGVIDRLDYLVYLGVTCIYFTPIFESPTNHRYDAINYHVIDPQLGALEDFVELMERAGQKGIRVLLDGVFNHCSSESIYFRGAQSDAHSPYYRWFYFNHWPDDYQGWAGVKTMPELVECPEVEEFFFGARAGAPGVAQHWLSFGTAGWRTDVTPWLSTPYWRRFRKAVRKDYPDAYLVSEDWGDASKRLLGDTFDATMNYRFAYAVLGYAGGRLSALALDDRLETLRRDTPPAQFHAQLNLIDSHDTPRALSVLKGSRDRLMLAASMLMAYPGQPMLCYGDEAGLEGAYAENSRRPFPWDHPDQALTDFYRKIIHARRQSPALSQGEVETAWIDPRGGYAFLRRTEEQVVLAAFNNSSEAIAAEIPVPRASSGQWVDLLANLPPAQVENGMLKTILPPLGTAWFTAML